MRWVVVRLASFAWLPRSALVVAAACTLLGLSAGGASAQNGSETPRDVAAETAEPPAVQPIPVDQIAVMAERVKGNVAEVRQQLADEEAITEIERELPERTQSVDGLLARSAEIREQGANVMILDQLRNEWRIIGNELDDAQQVLGRRAAQISRLREGLARNTEVWTATRAAATEAVEGREVMAQIDATIDELSKARDAAKRKQGDLAALQGRVARLAEAVAGDARMLGDIRREMIGRVFERDEPPVWSRAYFEALAPSDIGRRLLEHRDREKATLARFVHQHREQLAVQLVLTLVLIPLMYSARARVRDIDDLDDAVVHMKTLFEGPISLALLLAFFVCYWTYEDLPPLAGPVIGVTFLLPAVLVLRRMLEPVFFPILYALLVFFFVDQLIEIVAPLPSLPRFLFIVEMAAVFAVARWWRRPSRAEEVAARVESTASYRWVGFGMAAAMVAAPAAILADLSGFTALARMIGGTVLASGYAAVILYGSARAIDGLVAWLLVIRPFRLLGMALRQRAVIEAHVNVYTRWLMTVLFIYVVLRRLEIAEQVWSGIQAFWAFEIPLIAVGISMGSIIEFLIVIRFTFAFSRFVHFVLDEEVYTRVRMAKGQPYAISTLSHYVVLTTGFLLAIFALGIDVNRFTVLAGAFGVGIGFGLQTIVNNFVSGIILLTEQPVKVGDTIELQGVSGEVQRIGIRSSTVRTWQGAEVIVPNAQLIAEQVTNWTLSDTKRRLEIPVGVAYGTDPARVQLLLLEVARENDSVLADPEPVALFVRFGDSALEFELRCWTDLSGSFLRVRSDLVVAIERALGEADISIPFPQRDLHLRSVEPGLVPGSQAPAAAPGASTEGGSGLDPGVGRAPR